MTQKFEPQAASSVSLVETELKLFWERGPALCKLDFGEGVDFGEPRSMDGPLVLNVADERGNEGGGGVTSVKDIDGQIGNNCGWRIAEGRQKRREDMEEVRSFLLDVNSRPIEG